MTHALCIAQTLPMTSTEPEGMVGSREACQILVIDKSTLSRWAADGTLTPAMKLPGRNGAFLFHRADVDQLARQRQATA